MRATRYLLVAIFVMMLVVRGLPLPHGGQPTPSPIAAALVPHDADPTPSASASAVVTPTITATVPATVSLTASPSPTTTVAISATPSVTVTLAPTITPTATATLTPTATATITPTATTTLTPTVTSTVMPLPTITLAPSDTATPTVTPTPTAHPTSRPAPRPTTVVHAQISVSPSSINPGGVLTVKGSGFSARERVSIGLDSATEASTIADSSGAIKAARFAVPLTTGPGLHVVFAVGSTSHRRAQATTTVNRLAPALRLDQNRVGIGKRLCATGTTFLPKEQVTIAVDSVASAATTSSSGGSFSACFTVPANIVSGRNDVTAVGASSHASATATFTGVLAVASTFYFAGASTANGDDTAIPLVNPQPLPADVTLTIYLPAARPIRQTLVVAPFTRRTVVLSQYVVGTAGFALRVEADRLVAAQMVVRRGTNSPYATLGSSLLERRWYLADGATARSFHETLYVLNPVSSDTIVQVQLIPDRGTARMATYIVPGQRVYAIDVDRLYAGVSLSAIVSATAPVMVERVITFSRGGFGATGATAAAQGATTWIFAHGSTAGGDQTIDTIFNPGTKTARVVALLYNTVGHVIGTRTVVVKPLQRATMRLSETARSAEFATNVTSSQVVVIEQTLYHGDPDGTRTGGVIIDGRNGSGHTWTFADGDTALQAQEQLLVLNLAGSALKLHATFYLTTGAVVGRTFTVPANAHLSIDVRRALPTLIDTVHGAQLSALNNRGFIAEQTITDDPHSSGYSTVGLAQ